ncbi:MAG: DNRLRE domain-containing protein [candidate division Zixibacteria bacterium]
MKSFIISTILMLAIPVFGAEISVELDRCVVINASNDNTAESRFAFNFTLPNEVAGKEIIYAEFYVPVAIQNQESDLLYEFILFPLTSDWAENEIDYENSEAITDSMSMGAYTVTLESTNDFHIDITPYIMELVAGDRSNYGLIAYGDLLGDANIQLPENLGQAIVSNAAVRIIYK